MTKAGEPGLCHGGIGLRVAAPDPEKGAFGRLFFLVAGAKPSEHHQRCVTGAGMRRVPFKNPKGSGGACPPQARSAFSPGEGRLSRSAFSGAGRSTRPAFSGQARCTGGAGRLLPMVQCAPAHGPTGSSACRPHPRLAHTLVKASLRTRPGHSSRATPLKRALAIPARHRPHAQSAACLGRARGGFPLKIRRVQGGAFPPQARGALSPGEGRLSRSAFSGAGRSTRPAFSGQARSALSPGRSIPHLNQAAARSLTRSDWLAAGWAAGTSKAPPASRRGGPGSPAATSRSCRCRAGAGP